ncbi:MAG TPA: cobalamin biosynthesis protein, partial [Geomonas sp.]
AVVDHDHAVRRYCEGKGVLSYHEDFAAALESGASGQLFVTNRIIPREQHSDRLLVLRPQDLCLGIGCNRGTSAFEIESVVAAHLERLSLSFKSVKYIATAQAKGDESGLLEFAAQSGVAIQLYQSDQLNGVDAPSPASDHAFAAIGAWGVAEPAALLASGGGRLLLHKVKSGNVTLAIAEIQAKSKAG